MRPLASSLALLGLFLLPAHLVAGEHSPARLFLLRVFARWVEVPLLRLTYEACVGRLRFLTAVPALKGLLAWGVAYPFSRWGDTGRPVPHSRLTEYLEGLEGEIAVGPCRCRIGHRACGHPLETDIVIRTGTRVWLKSFPRDYRLISREEARGIVDECARLGLFHMVFLHCMLGGAVNEYVICNCCTDGCVPYIAHRTFGQERFRLVKGEWRAVVDADRCSGCGRCVELCPFEARRVVGGVSRVGDCYGCGLCEACERGATSMEPC